MSRTKIVLLALYLMGSVAASQSVSNMQYGIDDELVLEAELIPSLVQIQAPPTAKDSANRVRIAKAVGPEPLDSMRITSNFGLRMHPIKKRYIEHDGVDLAAKLNDPVRSVADGVVSSAGPRGGYGNAVEVYHKQLKRSTLYAHLNRIKVIPGQKVAQGQIVGLAGTTGLSTGVHLHFGVQTASGGYVNPLAFLAGLAGQAGSYVQHNMETANIANAAEVARPKRRSVSAARVTAVAKAKPSKRATQPETRIASARKPNKSSMVIAKANPTKAAPAAVIASAKPSKKPTQAIPTIAKRNTAELQDRFSKAAKQAEEFAMLYKEGAVSKNDLDSKIAAAKALESQLNP